MKFLTAARSLTAQLRADHGAEWGWTSGGCFAFAQVYAELHGGELWGVCVHDAAANDYPVDHALVRIEMADGSGPIFIDAEGLVDVTKLEAGRQMLPKSDDRVAWFEDDFLDDAQMDRLREILSRVGPWPGSKPKPSRKRKASR